MKTQFTVTVTTDKEPCVFFNQTDIVRASNGETTKLEFFTEGKFKKIVVTPGVEVKSER